MLSSLFFLNVSNLEKMRNASDKNATTQKLALKQSLRDKQNFSFLHFFFAVESLQWHTD
jgi:hypothetical protein